MANWPNFYRHALCRLMIGAIECRSLARLNQKKQFFSSSAVASLSKTSRTQRPNHQGVGEYDAV